jgi:type 1 glutamine amidotransferase
MRSILPILLLLSSCASAVATKRVLYVTATAGFRHTDSIDASIGVLQQIARDSGVLEIVHTEDLSLISAENLRNFDAIYFFTSGELPLSDQQKADLLDFVRQGKGFGGSHSATDCLYTWPDYGDMIGAYFDGHPWAQEAAVNVEDPENPSSPTGAVLPTTREFYQFRSFSRDRVRPLLTLDTRTVDMTAAGINRTDDDFALVWIRKYGNGRVFYSAFGHFPESFTSPPLRTMLMKGLLWITGEVDADATPRSGPSAPAPAVSANGVRSLGGGGDAFAPGALVSIAGDRLTSGSTLSAAGVPVPVRLAGTHVEVNAIPAPLFMATPGLVIAQLPGSLTPGQTAALTVSSVNRAGDPVPLRIEAAAPGIVAAARRNIAVLYVVGLGATQPAVIKGPRRRDPWRGPSRRLRFASADRRRSFFRSRGLVGVYQVNAGIPADAAPGRTGWDRH